MSQALTDASAAVREIDFLGMAARAHDTAGGQVCELTARQGPIAPPHRHPWPETHYVIEGEIEYVVAGALRRVAAGGFYSIPGNTVHALSAVSPTARWLEFTTPVGPADFFEQVSREANELPPDMAKVAAIAARYGVEVLLS